MRYLVALGIAVLAALMVYLAVRWRIGLLPRLGLGVIALAILAGGWWAFRPAGLPPHDDGADLRPLYAQKRVLPQSPAQSPVQGPVRVFHLGHSLVGRDMPAMLSQMAGHDYALQLGWGTALGEHFQGRAAINGFDQENATPQYRDAHQALASGAYDAFVMTEMVRLKDALLYKDSTRFAAAWAAEAVKGNPAIQVYLYESWHALDDQADDQADGQADGQSDWLARFPGDLDQMWSQLLWSASRATRDVSGQPVWLIPAGQVMAAVVHEAETQGIAELTHREQLFARTPEGALDPIHPNDLGIYLVALTHYAVLYGKSPVGLPAQLRRADGSLAVAPSDALALRMQQLVWQVVTRQPLTGI